MLKSSSKIRNCKAELGFAFCCWSEQYSKSCTLNNFLKSSSQRLNKTEIWNARQTTLSLWASKATKSKSQLHFIIDLILFFFLLFSLHKRQIVRDAERHWVMTNTAGLTVNLTCANRNIAIFREYAYSQWSLLAVLSSCLSCAVSPSLPLLALQGLSYQSLQFSMGYTM